MTETATPRETLNSIGEAYMLLVKFSDAELAEHATLLTTVDTYVWRVLERVLDDIEGTS